MAPGDVPAGDRDLLALARAAGIVGPQDGMPEELLRYSSALVHACAQIGDGYWREDASAGQHIRALYYPLPITPTKR